MFKLPRILADSCGEVDLCRCGGLVAKALVLGMILVALGGISRTLWAYCSAMRTSSYRIERPGFVFYPGPSDAELRRAAEVARRERLEKLVATLKDREERAALLATEKRRDNLENFFSRNFQAPSETRLEKAKELFARGQSSERSGNLAAARDYYLFTMQLAPGTEIASQAHYQLLALDEREAKSKGYSRGQGQAGILTQRDLEEIRKRAGQSFAEVEVVQQMLEQLAAESDQRRQALIIERLRDAKGAAYTDGLVRAMEMVSGSVRQTAREALLDRMTRMTAATLRDRFANANQELRLASVTAAGRKGARDLVPDLIELLLDRNASVRQAARTALREITGQDFGPENDADTVTQFEARQRWRAWWQSAGNAKP